MVLPMIPDKKKKVLLITLTLVFLCYSFYLYSSTPVKPNMESGDAIQGKLVWQQYNCTACHQIYGLGGYLGPDLTNSYSKKGSDYINVFLSNGSPTMPNFHLTEKEKQALMAYLKSLDASGSADPKTFKIHSNGTIEQ